MDENKSNDNVDIIRGDPKEAIRKLAPPLIISLLIMSLYNIIDRIWIAGLGTEPLAALGFVAPLYMVIVGLGNGLGAGANSLISRYIGSNNYNEASNAGIHGLLIVVLFSILIPIIIIPFLKPIIVLIGASEVLTYAESYISIIFIGTFAFLLNGLFANQLRAEGDVKRSTFIMVSGGIINIVLDPVMIYLLNFGLTGAAYSTVISNIIPDLLAVYWLYISKSTYLDYGINRFKFKWTVIKDLLAVGIPASIEELIMAVVNIVTNGMLSIVAGTAIVASFTSAFSIIEIATMPTVGVGIAAITVAGVAFGERNYNKLKTTGHYSIKLSLIVSCISLIIIYLFAPQIAYLFAYGSNSGSLNTLIVQCLRDLSLFLIAGAIGIVSANVLQGMGKGTMSLILTVNREVILILLFSYILGFVFSWGVKGILYGMTIGVLVGSLVALLVFELYLKRFKEIELRGTH